MKSNNRSPSSARLSVTAHRLSRRFTGRLCAALARADPVGAWKIMSLLGPHSTRRGADWEREPEDYGACEGYSVGSADSHPGEP